MENCLGLYSFQRHSLVTFAFPVAFRVVDGLHGDDGWRHKDFVTQETLEGTAE